jgi:hypothetical protein
LATPARRAPIRLSDARDVKSDPSDSTLSVQRVNAFQGSNEKAQKRIVAARVFLLDVKQVMDSWKSGHGKRELENSGANWRQLFNTNPDKTRRVLADTRVAIKEGKISKNPGAYAMDLYKRLPD